MVSSPLSLSPPEKKMPSGDARSAPAKHSTSTTANIKAMMGQSAKVADNDRARKQRELNGLLAWDKELDGLFERLYEDI